MMTSGDEDGTSCCQGLFTALGANSLKRCILRTDIQEHLKKSLAAFLFYVRLLLGGDFFL